MLFQQSMILKNQKTKSERYSIIKTDIESKRCQFAEAVKKGLTSKIKFLFERDVYDEQGSLLFEKICDAPEYYPARTENTIFLERANEIVSRLPQNIILVELGSGNSKKTCQLIEALLQRQERLEYVPIDISCSMLTSASRSLVRRYSRLNIEGIAASYDDGLTVLRERKYQPPKLILWLGSSIGHVSYKEAADFLVSVRSTVMKKHDAMLIGIDLKKDVRIMEAAYNDSHGANRSLAQNILVRINRELGGHFCLESFDYQAEYNNREGCMEINLISKKSQIVKIDSLALKVCFEKNEKIQLHNPYKYSKEDIFSLAENSGMKLSGQWTDAGDLFSVNLFSPSSSC